jgi:hypothetical protein
MNLELDCTQYVINMDVICTWKMNITYQNMLQLWTH